MTAKQVLTLKKVKNGYETLLNGKFVGFFKTKKHAVRANRILGRALATGQKMPVSLAFTKENEWAN